MEKWFNVNNAALSRSEKYKKSERIKTQPVVAGRSFF
jgi:hypothetical protein